MIIDGWMDGWMGGWVDGQMDSWGHLHSTGFCQRFPKLYNTWGVSEKLLSGTFLYLEDVFYLLEIPDRNHDGWDHLHSSGFCLRFPKMYNTWHVK